MASKHGKLLQLFSIKSKCCSKASPHDNISEHEVTDGSSRRVRRIKDGETVPAPHDNISEHKVRDGSSRRERRIKDGETVPARHGQSSVDQLEKELLKLRQILERKEAEMQKLKNEVSTLQIMTAVSSVQPKPQSQELPVSQEDVRENVNRAESFRSDASQLSFLDFSLASTGSLKLEGKIKTKITPYLKRFDRTASILSVTAKAPSRLVEKLPGNEASSLEERSTTKSTVSSHVQELDINHKLIGVTKIRVNASPAAISNRHDHSGGDLKLPKPVEGLDTCSKSYICEIDDEYFDLDAYQSRSPPKSPDSTGEQENFVFASPGAEIYLDSDMLFTPQTAGSLKVASLVGAATAGPKSSCALSDLEVDENSLVVDVKDGKEVDEKALEISVGDEAKNSLKDPSKAETGLKVANNKRSTSRIQVESLAEKCPLKVLSKVTQQAVAVASRRASMDLDRVLDETSLNTEMRSLNLGHNKLPKAMKSFRRVESSTSSKYPDLISMSASKLPLPRSPPTAPQAAPHDSFSVRLQSNESQTKSRNFLEQSKTSQSTTWNWNDRGLESKAVTVWRSDRQGEPMANSTNFAVESLPLLINHGRNSFGAGSNEYPMTTGDRHEGLTPVSSSPSSSPRVLSPSRYSARSQLLSSEFGWRVKSSGSEPFRPMVSDMNGESSLEATKFEEEVRDCLEKSRLLMCDVISMDDKCSVPVSPASREASFSVLALSRHTRSIEKHRSSVGSIPEIQKNELEWLESQDHLAIVSYVDNSTLNFQTSKIEAEFEARRRIDDTYIVSLQRLNNAGIAYDKKYARPACVREARDNKLGSSLSLPRKSRFVEEANSPRCYKVT